MTILSRLAQRAISPAQEFLHGLEDWDRQTSSGIAVTVESSMRAAIGRCVRLLADDISQLPLDFYDKVDGEVLPIPAPSWYDFPTVRRWDTWPAHISEVVSSLLTDGNAFIQGLPDAVTPQYFYVLDPTRLKIKEQARRVLYSIPGESDWDEQQVAHIPWIRLPGKVRGLSPVQASRESTGLELAARQWAANFFGNGATLGGVIEVPPNTPMTEAAQENLRQQFAKKHGQRQSHALGILTNGAKYSPTTIRPDEATLPAYWQQVLEEAASLYHIPPHMLASQVPGGQAYASVEQKSIDYVLHAIVPITRRLEVAYSRFLPGDSTYVKFNINALLRGDAKTRAEVNSIYLNSKVVTRDEVREKEDLRSASEAKGAGDPLGGFLETPNNNDPNASNANDAAPQPPRQSQ